MFFDNVQSQSSVQNTNLQNNISIGSSGTDFGKFNPVNETKPEFKSSNDLGMSAAIGQGAQSGSVGMSRSSYDPTTGSTYDGYSPPPKSSQGGLSNIVMYVFMAVTVAISLFAVFKKKAK